jgi:hypothetical protein
MIDRAPPPPRSGHRYPEQCAQQRRFPSLALAEQPFQIVAQRLDFPCLHIRARGTVKPLQPRRRFGKTRMQARQSRRIAAAQLKGQPPAPRWIVHRDAIHSSVPTSVSCATSCTGASPAPFTLDHRRHRRQRREMSPHPAPPLAGPIQPHRRSRTADETAPARPAAAKKCDPAGFPAPLRPTRQQANALPMPPVHCPPAGNSYAPNRRRFSSPWPRRASP